MLHFGSFEIRTDIFVLLLAIASLAVQLLLCFKSKRNGIRLIPIFLFTALTVICIVLALILDGWDSFGCVILAIGAAILLLACSIGWGVWYVARRKRKEASKKALDKEKQP